MKNTEINLDLEFLIKQMGDELRSGKPLTGAGGILTPLIKKVIESSLEGEMDAHLQKTNNQQIQISIPTLNHILNPNRQLEATTDKRPTKRKAGNS